MAKYGPHVEQLHAVAASPSGRLIAIGGLRDAEGVSGSRVHVLQAAKLTAVFSEPMAASTLALCFLADDLLVAGLADGGLVGWDAGSEKPQQVLAQSAGTSAVRALAADALGKTLAVVGDDGALRVYQLGVAGGKPRLELVAERTLSAQAVHAVAFDPTGTYVAAGGDDALVRSLPLADVAGAIPREMPCSGGEVRALVFPGDGRVVAGCADGSIRVFFLEGATDEEDRSREEAHTGAVRGLVYGLQCFDDVGRELPRRLFSVGEDGVLKAWHLDTRRKPRSLEMGQAPLHGLALLPPPPRTRKAEKQGGTLCVVTKARRLLLCTVDQSSDPAESYETVESEIDRLAVDVSASGQQVRETAVRALGELAEDNARKLLEHALSSDKRPEVRTLAAEVLGRPERRLARPALRLALNDDAKEVRTAALAALTEIEKDAPLSPVRAALTAKHEEMRLEAVSRLPALRQLSPLVPGLIADRLKDAAPKVRLRALEALVELEPAGSLIPLRTALARGPADVRVEALTRLGLARKTADPEGRALLEAALDDEDAGVRSAAFLISIAARGVLAARICTTDEHTRKALEEMGKRGSFSDGGAGAIDDAGLEPLLAAMACRHADTALRGARVLAILGDPRAAGALLQLSREASAEIRRYVVEALLKGVIALSEDERLVARLQWLLDDADPGVRATAFDVLEWLAGDDAQKKLELVALALRTGFDDVRVRALQILVEYGGEGKLAGNKALTARAEALLGDALDDEAAAVRSEAFRTLWAWHAKTPEPPLRRAATSRHADIRRRVVSELEGEKARPAWARELLLQLAADSASEVGLAAYKALTKEEPNKKDDSAKKDKEPHLAAMRSARPDVRAAGAQGSVHTEAAAVRSRLVELVKDEHPEVHLAAIEAIDKLLPKDTESFALAFDSIFYNLRVRAGELCGKRRDKRAVGPMKDLLTIPKTHLNRPTDELRQRAARALADVGDPETIPFYVSLLDDDDPVVREMGGRGLATACRASEAQPLVDALSHADLAVRSWAAEGLAKLGDVRALPVLAGTQRHEHRPIRVGSILSFAALGPDGVRGILQGLEDRDREIQDLVFAIIVARDLALAEAGFGPDLLLSALSSSHPEIRYAAARTLEARASGEATMAWAQELVGPPKPEKTTEMKDWPAEAKREAWLLVLVKALASDHPAQRYAAAQALSLRPQPEAFWREAGRLAQPVAAEHPWIPHTNWEDEKRQARRQGWIRRLFGKATEAPKRAESATGRVLTVLRFLGGPQPQQPPPAGGGVVDRGEISRLVFGAYAGLVRQAPRAGEADETHRIRRDSLERLAGLAGDSTVGATVVVPVIRRALSDPHHLVRKAASGALRSLYAPGALEPVALCLSSSAADVGKAALDELLLVAGKNEQAAALVREGINAPCSEVRSYALGLLPRLYPAGSIDPWLLAIQSQHADVRLSVVDRLIDAQDARVLEALSRALESDHEDLRLKAATALAGRGDVRTVDVLASFLRSEDARTAQRATEALIALAHARPDQPEVQQAAAAGASAALAARLDDDPDKTADRCALREALGRVGHPAGDYVLLKLLIDEDGDMRRLGLVTLLEIARDRDRRPQLLTDGGQRQRYREGLALRYLGEAAKCKDAALRLAVTTALRDIDDKASEGLLATLLQDREQDVRVAACEALAFRAEHVSTATIEPLAAALRSGRRELVLPAAVGLAGKRRPEAFQALLLVVKAGEGVDRERAVLALGTLGDRRALEEIEPLVDPRAEIPDEDKVLAPVAIEALGRMLPQLKDEEEQRRVRERVERLAREGSGELQLRALTGLRHAGDDRSRTLLERIAGDRYEQDHVRQRAVDELGQLARVESEPVLAELLTIDDYSLRHTALTALGRVFPSDPTRVSLLALRSEHSDVSQPAASFLARRGDAATLVVRLGEVKDDDVRRRLRYGLVRRRACPAEPVERLLRGEQAAPRAEAAWIAGAAGERALATAVVRAVELSADGWRKAQGKAMGSSSAPLLEQLRDEESAWSASLWAARQLEASAVEQARAALTGKDVPAAVRQEAIRLLGRRGSARDVEQLKPALSDRDAGVRAAAAAAVAALAPQQASQVLEKIVVADAVALVPVVVAALPTAGKHLLQTDSGRRLVLPVCLGQRRVEELVAIATASGKEPARLVAIAALGRIGGEEARAALEQILANKDEDDVIRATAYKALRRLQRAAEVRYAEGQDRECGRVAAAPAYGGDEDEEEEEDEDGDEDDEDDEDEDDGDEDDEDGDEDAEDEDEDEDEDE